MHSQRTGLQPVPHNNKPWFDEAFGELESAVRKVKQLEYENEGWFHRIDDAIDNLAYELGIPEIPYAPDSVWARENSARWNAAYRLEVLLERVKDAKSS